MSIFDLADLQLQRERILPDNKNYLSLLIDRAVTIRYYLDLQARNKAVAESRHSK